MKELKGRKEGKSMLTNIVGKPHLNSLHQREWFVTEYEKICITDNRYVDERIKRKEKRKKMLTNR